MEKEIIKIGIADDHELMRQGITLLLNRNKRYNVIIEAENGKALIELMEKELVLPDILIIDISMPVMNGYETISALALTHPNIKCIALSVNNDYNSVFKMIENGAKAYLKKDCSTAQFLDTIDKVYTENSYYSSFVMNSIMDYHHIKQEMESIEASSINANLNEKERNFIFHSCSELTYKEVASKMNIPRRTVDSYRESVFQKLNLKSRVGLVIYAIKNNIYTP